MTNDEKEQELYACKCIPFGYGWIVGKIRLIKLGMSNNVEEQELYAFKCTAFGYG